MSSPSKLEITSVQIRPHFGDNPDLVAFATIVFNDAFAVKDLKIINNGRRPLFVAMPARRCSDGVWRDLAHPIDPDTRAYIEHVVIETYLSQPQDDLDSDPPERGNEP